MSQSNSEPEFWKLKNPLTGGVLWMSPPINQDIIDSAASYKANSGDIFVCAYPKCGTTWMQNIVWLIVHNGESFDGSIRKYVPVLDFQVKEATEAIDDSVYPRIIKTHFPYSMTPKNSNAKYIYVTRNPKDALVSYYYHVKGFVDDYQCPDITLDKVFSLFMEGKVDYNSYFDHVVEWYSKRNESNILFLLYEDLKRDLKSNVMRIARFLGSDYEEKLLENDEEVLGKVLEQSSFKFMHKQATNIWTASKPSEDMAFIRKGEVGDWKNHLSQEQSSAIDRLLQERGKNNGIDKLWKNYQDVNI